MIRSLRRDDAERCEAIIRGLPDWFALEEGIDEARTCLQAQDGLIAEEGAAVLGFLTYTAELPETTEITWMAVAAGAHRRGIGRALIRELVVSATSEDAATCWSRRSPIDIRAPSTPRRARSIGPWASCP